ncbi:iron ABC transporter permease [Pasteurellaceae bacterium 20609_3]|uniref:FecCD family ABC transporter permease n=1 Tax=Spirabiliibacterium mucosae TaxID=28156 RepID=UPI001AAD37FE|nr:iron ABC transporter permease [Spirabiliibacterium mucosae]MBE2898771.1 iron ABC transporter permease [Spirabiliibacterium mucosae]
MSQPQLNSNRTLWLLALGLLATVLISLGLGRYALSLEQILTLLYQRITAMPMPAIESQVLFDVRLPRILTTGLVGAGLALSGAVLQGVFRNPLVDPHVIGVSSGAAFGGTLAIFFSLSTLALFASTLTFGIATLVLVFLFNRRVASGSLLMLILTGMILSGFFAALVSLLQYISDTEEKLPSIVFWLMGSFATANGQKLFFFALPWALCSAVLLGLRWRLNVLSLNDRDACALGVKVAPLRWCVLFCAGTIVACQVAISGSIGWVGLIIPHISRMLVGADHQKLLPTAMLVGAIYLIVIDDLARTLTASEIPISILTALLGAPVFALLVYRLRRQVHDE